MAAPGSAHAKARQGEGPPHEHKELHLYPGEKRLLFVVDAKLVLDVEAWGGPAITRPKRRDEPFGAGPTTAGRFRIGWIGRYHTSTWQLSKIPWGTRLKTHPTNSDDLLFEASPGQWRSMQRELAGKCRVTRSQIEHLYTQLYPGREVPPRTWVFNDFGPVAIRYYPDRNNNRQRDPTERLSGQMFHTTIDSEAGIQTMEESHGCIHLRPFDRNTLLANHALEIGTLVVIHDYGETSGVPKRSVAPAP